MSGVLFPKDILKDCRVMNGEVIVPGIDLPMDEITEALYTAVVDYNVPHYRVVGCDIRDNGRPPDTIVSNISGLMLNLVEVMQTLSKVIISDRVGDIYTPDVATDVGAQSELLGEMAHLCLTEIPDATRVTTSDFRPFGNPFQVAKTLTVGDHLFTMGRNVNVYVYMYRSTGILEFEDTSNFFKHMPGIVPCRTVYDLSDVFMVRPYSGGGTIKLDYFKDVDESVLTDILRKTTLGGGD